ncbi:carbon-monoxide dehydrogenase medium subunit [Thermomonospora echinospora]|uniref:Carbon-monoxide dehydrogenase medium subunit n=1 Tax=Thermomonospora echinospora TaxID=1992 RepID=A0A1H6D9Q8_9ACTN|nr:xanthine dehydrogenase family protein subunit M [Thermomonospora echinospora]SEG81415.1 carbon-monoxide dehydrogenase medium subunit [Thermomonospora echinospora]
MKPSAFDYHAPTSVAEAVSLLADLGEDAKPIAGGQSLVPMLALRLTALEHLVDLRRVSGLRGIEQRDGAVRIGAMTTQAVIGRSAEVARGVPLLARATPLIGHFQIRNRGTIGGSLAHADAAAEYPAVALALGAQLEAQSPRGRRTIPADRFFTGLWGTDLADDELLTAVAFPRWDGRCGFAIEEFARRSGDFAIAGAAVAVALDDGARIRRCGIGLFGLGPTPLRASAAEAALTRAGLADVTAEDVGRTALADLESVPSDLHGSADYRRHVGAVVVARAWQRAVQEASDA